MFSRLCGSDLTTRKGLKKSFYYLAVIMITFPRMSGEQIEIFLIFNLKWGGSPHTSLREQFYMYYNYNVEATVHLPIQSFGKAVHGYEM